MAVANQRDNFFVTGGTLRYDAPSYVERIADTQLLRAISQGKFCYILTPRQMGKSSLMVKSSYQLEQAGYRTAIIDLTSIGTSVTAEQWYYSLIDAIDEQLEIIDDLSDWWESRQMLGSVGRFSQFIEKVVLTKISEPFVIYIDEIDTTLNLSYTDDFFAAIRALYNKRTQNPALQRINFVLLGVAKPADLITDSKRTPFNIGQSILLSEFRRNEANVLQEALPTDSPKERADLFDRIYYWTNGHPYLTQRICDAVSQKLPSELQAKELVDKVVNELFLSSETIQESNLQFAHNLVMRFPDRVKILSQYRKTLSKKSIKDNPKSESLNHLKLAGLLKINDGMLVIRNPLYRTVFNQRWVQDNLPGRHTTKRGMGCLGITVIIFLMVNFFLINQRPFRYYSGEAISVTVWQEIFASAFPVTLILFAGIGYWFIHGQKPKLGYQLNYQISYLLMLLGLAFATFMIFAGASNDLLTDLALSAAFCAFCSIPAVLSILPFVFQRE